MTDARIRQLDALLERAGRNFAFPETPDIAGGTRQRAATRIPFWRSPALATLAVLLVVVVAVPPVRSTVVDWIRVGAAYVFRIDEDTVDTHQPGTDDWIRQVATVTTLHDADRAAPFPIVIPAAAFGYGRPDEVYLQAETGESANVFLVWRDGPGPRLALYLLSAQGALWKGVSVLDEVSVNGRTGLWIRGPHMLRTHGNTWRPWFFVEGNVLLWQDGGITYRLETTESIEVAVAIAESLEAVSPEEE